MFDPHRVRFAAHLVVSIPLVLLPAVAHAACNEPPPLPEDASAPPVVALLAATGGASINTPFLIPGMKKVVGHTVSRSVLIAANTITDTDVVTVAYPPPEGKTAPRAIVVLAKSCNGVKTCSGDYNCLPTNLTFGTMPKSVRFDPDDLRVNGSLRAGHVRIAVSGKNDVPCDLSDVTKDCSSAGGGLHTCIDELTPSNTTEPRMKITHLTALPAPNNFKDICESILPNVCGGAGKELSFTLDANGDILVPMFWGKVLQQKNDPSKDCDEEGVKCKQEDVAAATSIPADPNSNDPIVIPTDDPLYKEYLQTFNEVGEGFSDKPDFFPEPDPDLLRLAGDIDKPYSVLRIRRKCDQAAPECTSADSLFDLTGYIPANGGPIVIERASTKKGKCKTDPTKECDKHSDCTGGPCLRFEGEVKPIPQPAPPPPAPGPPLKTFPLTFWALVALALGVAYLLIRRLYP